MAYPTIEQYGLFLNMVAGILMGADFIIKKEWIDKLNELFYHIIIVFRATLSAIYIQAKSHILLYILVFILFLPIYISTISKMSLFDSITTLLMVLYLIILIEQLYIKFRWSYFIKPKTRPNKETKFRSITSNNQIYTQIDGTRTNGLLHKFVFRSDLTTLVTMIIIFYLWIYISSSSTGYHILTFISLGIFYCFLIFMMALVTASLLIKVLTFSPKGVLGSIGIIFFIIGNALQLWDTFK